MRRTERGDGVGGGVGGIGGVTGARVGHTERGDGVGGGVGGVGCVGGVIIPAVRLPSIGGSTLDWQVVGANRRVRGFGTGADAFVAAISLLNRRPFLRTVAGRGGFEVSAEGFLNCTIMTRELANDASIGQ